MNGRNNPRTYHANPIAKRRVLLGYTQDEAATRLGVHRVVVAKWESGRVKPNADNLVKLAKLYGCTIEDLLA